LQRGEHLDSQQIVDLGREKLTRQLTAKLRL